MTRSINQVKNECLTIAMIFHLYGMTLDGDATLALKVHIVEHLVFGNGNGFGIFQQTVGQCRLTMVYMGYDAKIANILHVYV